MLGIVRLSFLLGLMSIMLSGCITSSSSGVPRREVLGGRLEIRDIRLSPDGQIVSFDAFDRAERRSLTGLLDWRSGELTRIPGPGVGVVVFSPDGMHVFAGGRSGEISIGRRTFTMVADAFGGDAVFQPGTGNILYVKKPYPDHLVLVNPIDHSETTILDAKHGFYAILKPSFVAQNEIVFAAMGPTDPDLIEGVKQLGVSPITNALEYRLSFGGKPEFTAKEIFEYSRSIDPRLGGHVTNIATSLDGKITAFIDKSITDPNLKGAFNWEIFLLESGKIRQMTKLKSLLYYIAISADGSTVAFGSDPTRTLTPDLLVLDVRSGVVSQMHLAQRFEASPEFNKD